MPFESAVHIVQTLKEKGYTAYFAGGWVRDYLRGHPSEDIDIATTASPDEVLALFPKTIEVGKAFGVVIVVEDGHQFEVASFRKEGLYLDGRKPESIQYSTPEEDAQRRDFTINGMFYDPIEKNVIDYVGGQRDLKRGVIRAVANAHERFVEDRLRMIRAVRFSARFNFPIEEKTESAIRESAPYLYPSVSVERVWNELSRMAAKPGIRRAIQALHDLGLLGVIFPSLMGISQEILSHRIDPLVKIPKEVPAILFFAHLFPHEKAESHFLALKVSGQELKLLSLFERIRDAEELDLVAWTHLYAQKHSEIVLETLYCSHLEQFQKEHRKRWQNLEPHINRIREKNPLVGSQDLIGLGVKPGVAMGEWLRFAERIAIEEDLQDPEPILQKLREALNG